MFIHRTRQCLFRHQCTLFKSAADTHSYYHRRTRIRSRILHCCQNCIFHTLNAVCGLKHKDSAHILTAKALRCYRYPDMLSRNNAVMNDCRCIIFRIFPVNRIFYHRFSQISIYISLSDTFIDGIFHISSYHMHITETGSSRSVNPTYTLYPINIAVQSHPIAFR